MTGDADTASAQRKGLMAWVDARFPLTRMWDEQWGKYSAPRNLNAWYYFGSLSLFVLVIQLVSGIFLTMSYKPSAAEAFGSVEYIMRDLEWGWLLRYLHSTGASAFFVVVYLHMFRAMLYGSYRKPRELLWIVGMLIYVALSAEAFMGYLLPWGNLSYWGAQVIVSLFGTIPVIGGDLVDWIRGDYFISDVTLNRFFALHVVAIPLVMIFLVAVHVLALHEVGSNNPEGRPVEQIPSHPYYSVKDLMGVAFFLVVFLSLVFFAPEMGGLFLEAPNFEPANPVQTPMHIAPVWYFTPFYAMLRSVPAFFGTQIWGVIVMGAAMVILFFLPWLDHSPVKSIRYRGPIYRIGLALFVVTFIMLGYCGLNPVVEPFTTMSVVGTVYYFAFFLLMPWYSRIDRCKPQPAGVTHHVD